MLYNNFIFTRKSRRDRDVNEYDILCLHIRNKTFSIRPNSNVQKMLKYDATFVYPILSIKWLKKLCHFDVTEKYNYKFHLLKDSAHKIKLVMKTS